MGNKIQLFGELESVAVDKKLVDAVQVKDSAWVDPEEMILALAEEREPIATEETQSKINERLREEALYAQSQLQNLSLHYNATTKRLQLLLEGEAMDNDGIDASDFTKDGMIETVLGPVTPVWNDVTDRVAAGTPTEKVEWAVNEDNGEQAFFALERPAGYLLIQEITLGNTYLGFIWNTNTDAGKTEGKVYDSANFKASALDVSTLFNPIQPGPGLKTDENGVTMINIKDTDDHKEKYLVIDKDGLFSTGIDTAIEAAVKTVSESVTTLEGTVTTLGDTVDKQGETIKTIQTSISTADLTAANKNIADLKRSVAVRQHLIYSASQLPAELPRVGQDTIIRNIHCYYGQEEIEVLVKRGTAKGSYRDGSVTIECNTTGLTLSQDTPIRVLYEEVLYDAMSNSGESSFADWSKE